MNKTTSKQHLANWRELHKRGYFREHKYYACDPLHALGIVRLKKYLELKSTDVLLDVGCGYGRALHYLLPLVQTGIGVDIAEEPIEQARVLLKGKPCELYVTNGRDLSAIVSNAIDAAFAFTVFQHIPRSLARATMNELYRVLKPNGRLCIQFMTGGDTSTDIENRVAEQSISYDAAQIQKLAIDCGFRVKTIELEKLQNSKFHWWWLSAVTRKPIVKQC